MTSIASQVLELESKVARLEKENTALLAEVAPHREREADRLRKRGSYWLSEEGRAEIRECWDDPEDGDIPLPLLNELERLESKQVDRETLTKWFAMAMTYKGVGDPNAVDVKGDPRWKWNYEEAEHFVRIYGYLMPVKPVDPPV